MSEVVKSGNLFKYSDTVFNTKWKFNYVELLRNSTLKWFENKGDRAPKRSVVLKDVCSFLAFGDIVKQLPFKPDVKEEQISLLIAIPHDNNRNTRLSFFLCNNQTEMQEWVNSILSTISDQNQSQSTSGGPQGGAQYPQSGAPPAAPRMAGPYQGPQPPYQTQQAPYQGQQARYPGAQPPYQGQQAPYQGPHPPYQGSQAPYQGPSPPYGQAPSNGPPPAIGFNVGGAPSGSYPPNYQGGPSNPRPAYQPPYQQPYQPPYQQQAYPVQPRPYVPGAVAAPQTYMPGQPAPQAAFSGQIVSQPTQAYVIVDGKKRKKKSKLKNAAIGLAAGAVGAYATHKLFHGYGQGWGGGWGGHHGYYDGGYYGHHGGHYGGHWGSWSSLSSYDSFGSFSD